MLQLDRLVDDKSIELFGTMSLPFGQRQKSRFRGALDSGQEIAVIVPRGLILRGGDRLGNDLGHVVEVLAAPESVSTVVSGNPQELARAAYHLGNRHVSLQIGDGWLRYLHDHVLDDMVRGLGLQIKAERAPFEPEAGAYHGGHSHAHHEHAHSHP